LTGEQLDDDPVPSAVIDALGRIDLSGLRDVLMALPQRASKGLQQRLSTVRTQLRLASQDVRRSILSSIQLTLPLLIVDEAHRLKKRSHPDRTAVRTEDRR